MSCIFCQIVKGDEPAEKVYEDDQVLAFRDIRPVAPVHVLIIPKKHIENLAVAEKEDVEVLGRIQIVASDLAEREGVRSSFRLATASGAKAGQTVFHLHYHLIGGWQEKAPKIWGG